MTKDLISIIVPVYDTENYLCRCIDSLITQTYAKIEIILVDDGSRDNCPSICDNYQRLDSRVISLHKENGGLSSARNYGLSFATGEYLMFVDSDDWITADFCEKAILLIKGNHVDMCSFGLVYVYSDHSDVVKTKHPRVVPAEKAIEYTITGEEPIYNYLCNKIFNAALFNGLYFLNGYRFEDIAIMYLLLYRAKKVYLSDEVTYNYLQRDGSITSKYNDFKSVHDRFYILKTRLSFLKKNYKNAYSVACKELVDLCIDILLHHHNSFSLLKDVRGFLHDNHCEALQISDSKLLRILFFTHIL